MGFSTCSNCHTSTLGIDHIQNGHRSVQQGFRRGPRGSLQPWLTHTCGVGRNTCAAPGCTCRWAAPCATHTTALARAAAPAPAGGGAGRGTCGRPLLRASAFGDPCGVPCRAAGHTTTPLASCPRPHCPATATPPRPTSRPAPPTPAHVRPATPAPQPPSRGFKGASRGTAWLRGLLSLQEVNPTPYQF